MAKCSMWFLSPCGCAVKLATGARALYDRDTEAAGDRERDCGAAPTPRIALGGLSILPAANDAAASADEQ
jgi:hypothetical protein